MPERGRPSASSGNAYHDVRVALCLIDLLEDASVSSVVVESLDATDDLVVHRSDGMVRYEQVKERAPSGHWTATRLSDEGVLRQFVLQHRSDPHGELVLFTGSDASDFREVVERARNAFANHPSDEPGRQAAETEWKRRLKGRRNFVEQILSRITTEDCPHAVTWRYLHELLDRVQVLDAQGTIAQLRERGLQRLRLLVDDPVRALQTLERLAREAAIRRSAIRQRVVETALKQDGSGPFLALFALAVDADAYAAKILGESAAVDVAKLMSLVPNLHSPHGQSFDLNAVCGKTLLVGGHGAGKSRIAADLAVKSIRNGRQCLHIRLARWATTLRDLLVAELSVAARRRARYVDVDNLFAAGGALVLDGFDEVPAAQRLTAEREILQFADAHPHVDILVTCRPGSGHTLSQYWPAIELCPLSDEQIERALGRKLHTLHLGEPIVDLAGNPLMLGMLVKLLAGGGRPSNEADLLDAFVTEIVERESKRLPSIDNVSGQRLVQDAAFEWLSSGRIALEQDQLRNVAASVALSLRRAALLQTDATEVEQWLIEAGFGVKLGAVVVPVHRAVLDHLAGRSMVRRDAIRSARLPELREAVARYHGCQAEVSERMLSLLSAVGTDIELLARGQRLTSRDIIWPFDPVRFATEYLAELRRLCSGPLVDIGVVARTIEIDIDRDITWISERDRVGSGDIAKIVDAPERFYITAPGGSNHTPVKAFSSAGYRGTEIDIRVPHFAAFARVGDGIQTLLRRRALPDEGPDIVYERLCSLATRLIQTATRSGTREYQGFSDADFRRLTASGLQDQFLSVATGVVGAEGDLTQLVVKATRLGIQELPLHPLMLLPNSTTDHILSLPGCRHLLRGDSLSLYVERHEYGEMRAFRYLVEHNLRGLRPHLRRYSMLPWHIEMAIEDRSTPMRFDADIRSIIKFGAAADEVAVVSEIPENDSLWTRSSTIHAYRGVLAGAYDLVEYDVQKLLTGTNPLGSAIL